MIRYTPEKLSQEKVQQLLAVVGENARDDISPEIESVDYDWRKCHYFRIEQCARLVGFSREVGDLCGKEFSRLYHRGYKVSVVSSEQHFAKELYKVDVPTDDYLITFGDQEESSFGVVIFTPESARIWTGQMLGGDEEVEKDHKLSTLEESLLLDIAFAMLNAFSEVYQCKLSLGDQKPSHNWPKDWADDDEFYKITLDIIPEEAEQGHQASFIVRCKRLLTVAGQNGEEKKPLSDAQVKKIMTEHVSELPVQISAKLGTVKIDFGAVAGLEAGDILVLDRKLNEPIEVLVEGKTFKYGRPAKSEGNYAVSIL